MRSEDLLEQLAAHPTRAALVAHPFFKLVERRELSKADVEACISQWWHPLAYFPTFISQTIAGLSWLSARSALSKILYQELGEGDAGRSHEGLFIETMQGIGMSREAITRTPALAGTRALVEGMARAPDDPCVGLGYVYGIEVVDLPLVSWVGEAIRAIHPQASLPWVDVHLLQESDHVENVRLAASIAFTDDEAARIIAGAEAMWSLWFGFFSGLREAVAQPSDAFA